MSLRQCLCAWAMALVMLVAGVTLLQLLAPSDPHRFRGEPVAVVGASLLAYGLPASGEGAQSLLGDGRRHRRLTIRSITEAEALDLARQAIDGGAQVLLIELDPFIKTAIGFEQPGPCDGAAERLRWTVWQAKRRFVEQSRLAAGLPTPTWWIDEPRNLDQPHKVDLERLANIYPPHLHEPACKDGLERLIRKARRAGTEVVLVLPPRSFVAAGVMKQAVADGLRHRAERLAKEFDVALFAPASPWPDAEFIDHAHLNRQGRAHLVSELQQWWKARQ